MRDDRRSQLILNLSICPRPIEGEPDIFLVCLVFCLRQCCGPELCELAESLLQPLDVTPANFLPAAIAKVPGSRVENFVGLLQTPATRAPNRSSHICLPPSPGEQVSPHYVVDESSWETLKHWSLGGGVL
jgi:hypothetical protein